jgi:hypothetical protein
MNFLFRMNRTLVATGISHSQVMQGYGIQFLSIKIRMEYLINGLFTVD